MRTSMLLVSLLALIFFAVSCEQETNTLTKESEEALLDMAEEEIQSEVNFAELLNDGDDGSFWGDNLFLTKSAEGETGTCPTRTRIDTTDLRIVTLDFSGEDCPKNGVMVIEYQKPTFDSGVVKKTVTHDNLLFKKCGRTFNGFKEIVKGTDNVNVTGEMNVTFSRDDKDVSVDRNYHRQLHWICGPHARKDGYKNIRTVTGTTEVSKTITKGDTVITRNYTRQILKPLLVVSNPNCMLKIQAGTVKITKTDGSFFTINYGEMPKDVDCTYDDYNNVIEITKDGVTYKVEIIVEDNQRVRIKVQE